MANDPAQKNRSNRGQRHVLKDSDPSWNRVPFQVKFGEDITSMMQAMRYMNDAYQHREIKNGVTLPHAEGGDLSDEQFRQWMADENFLGKPFFKDTRLGANDAINCIWQFNRDDDIVHPIHQSDTSNPGVGMGRVYAQSTEQNQTIAYFTFGVPRFTNILAFWKDAINKELVKLNVTGFNAKVFLGRIFGSVGQVALSISTLPLRIFWDTITKSQNLNTTTRFFDLRTTMHIYYKYVDSILAQWLVSTGIYGNNTWAASPESLPLAMRETGPSIWDINMRRAKTLGNANGLFQSSGGKGEAEAEASRTLLDMAALIGGRASSAPEQGSYEDDFNDKIHMDMEYWDESAKDGTNWWSDLCDFSKGTAQQLLGATQFIGFRIEKSTNATESFSNSTGPSTLAEQANQRARQIQEKFFNFGLSDIGSIGEGNAWYSGITDSLKSLLGSGLEALHIDGLASFAVGAAFIDIPDSYKSSEFNKSHSLSFELRSPYGDIVSIYQSIIVPLACILAGALPKASGPNSYTQPFLCRVNVKGMFSIPLGIIDSVSIERGSSEFGWTYQNLPTRVNVTIGIKDLSPVMYIGLKDELFPTLFANNSAFDEYITILAGMGLQERVLRKANFMRNAQLALHKIRNRYANPNFYSSAFSHSLLGGMISSILPWCTVPHD